MDFSPIFNRLNLKTQHLNKSDSFYIFEKLNFRQHTNTIVFQSFISTVIFFEKKNSHLLSNDHRILLGLPNFPISLQVMKTPLGDLEIQNVIDLLLTRQTGSSTSNYNDWIDASGQQNETKMLSNQLAEKDALLAEEMDKVKSITDKMAALR